MNSWQLYIIGDYYEEKSEEDKLGYVKNVLERADKVLEENDIEFDKEDSKKVYEKIDDLMRDEG